MNQRLCPSASYRFDAIDAYVERHRRRLRLPGLSLAIVEGDQIVHLRGFGRARPGGEAPGPQTPFFIGSLTKAFTALAIMQLVEAGRLELEAPVQRYLPWFRVADAAASAQMTVRHLLHQTSGLPTAAGEILLADFDQRPGATERQARALSTLVLTCPPGSAFEYSNANYSVLGLILEAASGEPYADYIQKHILTPLGMSHSYTSPTLARQNGLATGHQYLFGFPFPAPNVPIPGGSLPAGLLISSAADMARYLVAHLNGGRCGDQQLLSSAGIEALLHGVAEFRALGISVGKYGMGWFDSEANPTRLVWHGGTLPNFGAYMGLQPAQKQGVVLLFNACHHWMTPVLTEFGAGVAALLVGAQPRASRFGFIPWALRGLLLIPFFQLAEVASTLRRLRRWHLQPEQRPAGAQRYARHILWPLILNLPVALSLKPMLGQRRGYLKIYMPDYALVAWACGSFALLWSIVRTGLMLDALSKWNKRRSS